MLASAIGGPMQIVPAVLLLALFLPFYAQADESCRVFAVHDGAHLSCRTANGRVLQVRLRGIDVPAPVAEPARQRLEALVDGHTATLRHPLQKAAGPLEAAVWVTPPDCPRCGHTLDVGRALLSVGLACWRPDPAQGEEERAQYSFEEQEARARKVGLWHRP